MKFKFLPWIPFAIIITAFCGLAYVLSQQSLRMSANDPQIAISEDLANQLSHDQSTSSLASLPKLDISQSLSPFLIIYDNEGNRTFSTAEINKKPIDVPKGVLEYTKVHRQDRVTWQPAEGMRMAIVVTHFEGKASGFVVAGRSLEEVEKRSTQLLYLTALVWVITMASSFIAVQVALQQKKKR